MFDAEAGKVEDKQQKEGVEDDEKKEFPGKEGIVRNAAKQGIRLAGKRDGEGRRGEGGRILKKKGD